MKLVEDVFRNGEIQEDDEVILIYVSDEKDKIRLSSTLRGKKKKLDKYISDNVPSLPSALEKDLRNKLKKLKNEAETIKKQKNQAESQNLELQIRDAFIDFFVEIFQDYGQYLSFVDEDTVFNKPLFIEKKKTDKNFYNELLDTQLFQQFTQNIINEEVQYFNYKIGLKEEGKKNKPVKTKEKIKEFTITPTFVSDDIVNSSKDENKGKKINRILTNSIEIDDNKYKEEECIVYLTPEEKKEIKEAKDKKEEDKDKPTKKQIKVKTNKAILDRIKKMNLNASSGAKKREELSEREQDNIKETIKDNVVKIFKSEETNLETKEKNELFKQLNKPFGRNFFISLLSKNTSNVILLKENSFHLLWTLINECIVSTLKCSETKNILENICLLMKSTRYFGITENGTTLTMFEKYTKVRMNNIPKIKQENFWQIWFDIDLKKKTEPTDEDKQEIIYDICKTLLELEMPKSIVKKLTDAVNIKIFGKGTELQKKTFECFIKFIVNAKYVSQVI
jgi:hypothetical protein